MEGGQLRGFSALTGHEEPSGFRAVQGMLRESSDQQHRARPFLLLTVTLEGSLRWAEERGKLLFINPMKLCKDLGNRKAEAVSVLTASDEYE